MKTLLQIKDEVAMNSEWNKDWESVPNLSKLNLIDEVCRRAQLECGKATLEKASEKADVHTDKAHSNGHPMINKSTITSEENIVIIK